jgi:hypothetical protein
MHARTDTTVLFSGSTSGTNSFTGSASLSSGSSYISLTIDGSFSDKNVCIGATKLYKINCDRSRKSVEITLNVNSDKLQWTSKSVLNTDEVHSKICTNSFYEFILEIDLLYSLSISSALSKSIDFKHSKYTDTIVAVKNEQFKVYKAILMEKSLVFERMVRQLLIEKCNNLNLMKCSHSLLIKPPGKAWKGL